MLLLPFGKTLCLREETGEEAFFCLQKRGMLPCYSQEGMGGGQSLDEIWRWVGHVPTFACLPRIVLPACLPPSLLPTIPCQPQHTCLTGKEEEGGRMPCCCLPPCPPHAPTMPPCQCPRQDAVIYVLSRAYLQFVCVLTGKLIILVTDRLDG